MSPTPARLTPARSLSWPPSSRRCKLSRRLLNKRHPPTTAGSHSMANSLTLLDDSQQSPSNPSLSPSSSTGSYQPLASDSPIFSLPDSFEDELNDSPESHFLSPMPLYEYADDADVDDLWAYSGVGGDSSDEEDDDDDADDVAWNAGITDFALFDRERREASATPGKWQALLDSQASALQRAVERNRSSSIENGSHDPSRQQWLPLLDDDLPQLTPDNSPNIRDDFDLDAYAAGGRDAVALRLPVPNYLHTRLPAAALPPGCQATKSGSFIIAQPSPSSPPKFSNRTLYTSAYDAYDSAEEACTSTSGGSGSDFDDDDSSDSEADVPIAALLQRARERRLRARQLERPGLRGSRTLSGKIHAWRRPGWNLPPMAEEGEIEEDAER